MSNSVQKMAMEALQKFACKDENCQCVRQGWKLETAKLECPFAFAAATYAALKQEQAHPIPPASTDDVVEVNSGKAVSSIDAKQREGVAVDILRQAINAYEDWYLADHYDAQLAWDAQMKTLIERCKAFGIIPDTHPHKLPSRNPCGKVK